MPIKRETLGEALFYEYARIIADARFNPEDRDTCHPDPDAYWSFLVRRYGALCRGRIGRSPLQKESRRAARASDRCAYCGGTSSLQWDHVIPLCRGGPDCFDNLVRACRRCNASKGAKPLTDWAAAQGLRLSRWLRARHMKLLLDQAESTGRMAEPAPGTSRAAMEQALFVGSPGR